MARTNNLTNFLTDVATAIKEKLGSKTAIPASQFDAKIRDIQTIGTYQSKTINISANGSQTVEPDANYDALSSVSINVAVPQLRLQSKVYEFTENASMILYPETGYDGFSSITLTIAVPSSQINNQDKTITQNGTYTADQGYTGLGQVNVNVGTEPDVRLFTNRTNAETYMNTFYQDITPGKYCTIYGEITTIGIPSNTYFTNVYLPTTITFSEAITENKSATIEYEYEHTSGGGGSGGAGNLSISPTELTMYFMFNGDYGHVQYTSVDGITYTRDGEPQIESRGYGEVTLSWDSSKNILYFIVSQYVKYVHIWHTSYDAVIPQALKTAKPKYDGLYQYASVKNDDIRQTGIHIADWYNNTLPANCEYAYYNKQGTSYSLWGKVTRQYTKQGKQINEMNTMKCNTNGYTNAIFIDGSTCRVGYRTYKRNTSGSNTYAYWDIALDGTKTEHSVTRNYADCPYYQDGSYYYFFFEEFNFPVSELSDWMVLRGTYDSGYTIYMAKNSWTKANISTITWPTYNNDVNFLEMVVPESQITLNNANQILPSIIAVGQNGEVIGDGSIYQNLDLNKVATDIFNLTPIGSTGSTPIYSSIPMKYAAARNANLQNKLCKT